MKIYFEKDDKNLDVKVEGEKPIKDILDENGIILESVILVKNGTVCLEDGIVSDTDELKILSVVSGG